MAPLAIRVVSPFPLTADRRANRGVGGALTYVARYRLAKGWRSLLVVALVAGAMFGSAAAAAAGARRTASAYTRFTQASDAWEAGYINYAPDGTAILTADQLRALPGVTGVDEVRYEYAALGPGTAFLADPSGRLGTAFARPRILEGSWFHPGQADEAVVSFALAEREGLSVGDSFQLFPLEYLEQAELPEDRAFANALLAALPGARLRVVGIVAAPGQFPPLADPGVPLMQLSPAFAALPEPSPNSALLVQLQEGADVDGFRRAVDELAREQGQPSSLGLHQDLARDVGRSLRPQVVALAVLSLVLLLAALVVSGQAIVRHGDLDGPDTVALHAVGMTSTDLRRVAALQWGLVALVSGLVAPVVAFALSPLSPTGLARLAEPARGARADAFMFVIAAVLTIAVVLGLGVGASALRAGRSLPVGRSRFAALPLHPVIGIGVRRAFDRGDRLGRVPVWSTIVGATIGIAAIAASLTVATSLTRQLDNPELYGLRWELELAQFSENTLARGAPALLAEDARVSGAATGISGPVPMAGTTMSVVAMDPVRGEVRPPLVRGSYPDAPDSVALGGRTLGQLGAEVGGQVELDFGDVGGQKLMFRVVGEVMLPAQGTGGRLDEGIFLSLAGIQRAFGSEDPIVDTVFLAAAPGIDLDVVVQDLIQRIDMQEAPSIDRPTTPSDLVDLGRVRSMPAAFAAAMALVGAGALAHTLLVSVRRRRQETAVLRAVGFRSSQLYGAALVQACTLAVVASVIGIPLGITIGRRAWDALAESVGSSLPAQVPLLVMLLALPAAVLALAALLSVIPGRRASRLHPAAVLRAE